jgi:alpha-glucosidase
VADSLLQAPHHDGSSLYLSTEAPALGEAVTVFVRTPATDDTERIWVRSTPDAEPVFVRAQVDRRTTTDTWWRADIRATNPTTRYRFQLHGGKHGDRWLNGSGVHRHDVTDAADFQLSTSPLAPRWGRDAVVYQVFIDRFARSAAAADQPLPAWAVPAAWDDDVVFRGPKTPLQVFGGDLGGVAEHLDHIEALGADTIYLTPFFPAESNHRYNASSFDSVEPLIGGDKALAHLSQEVHRRGMHLLGDLTTNHCGDTHDWLRRAVSDPSSPEHDYFYFSGPDESEYVGWLGHSTLPKLRHTCEELRTRFFSGPDSIAGRWLQPPFELDGWRIDVANMTGRHGGDDVNHDVARYLRRTLAESGGERLLIAEHCHDATTDLPGDGWHGTMNYAGFTRPVWNWLKHPDYVEYRDALPPDFPPSAQRVGGELLVASLRHIAAEMPWRSLRASWSLLGSHDSARIRTVVQNAELGEVAAGLLFTMPGVPMIFAGDEIGQTGVMGEDARRPFPWEQKEQWDQATLSDYRALIRLRRNNDALRDGGLRWVHASADTVAFLRESVTQRLLVLAQRGPTAPTRLLCAELGLTGEADNLYGGAQPLRATPDGVVTLAGDGPTFQVWQLS